MPGLRIYKSSSQCRVCSAFFLGQGVGLLCMFGFREGTPEGVVRCVDLGCFERDMGVIGAGRYALCGLCVGGLVRG